MMKKIKIGRVIIVWIIDTIAIMVAARLVPGFIVTDWGDAFLVAAVLGLINALIRPTLLIYLTKLNLIVFVIIVFLLNGIFIVLASALVPGVEVRGVLDGLVVAIVVTAVNTLLTSFLAINDDDSYYQNVTQRIINREVNPKKSDVPGIIFLEIDGLSEDVFLRAVREGYMPTMKRWIDEKSHKVIGWECDWSSQTSASQAGLLHGNNHDIPAFRWYEKETGRIMVSNHHENTLEIEQSRGNGKGLLANDGFGISNMFSGDARKSRMTFSTIADENQNHSRDYYVYFVNPYNLTRAISLFIWEVVTELRAARQQRRRNIVPRGHRGGIYPFLRAFTTIVLREISTYSIIGDMFGGIASEYVTFVAYDEVAHHSGIVRPDAMEVLYKLDQQFARIEKASAQAPRPYYFVVLSDHGQTQGSTFKQRYGMTLEEYVGTLLQEGQKILGAGDTEEAWGNLNAFLADASKSNSGLYTDTMRKAVSHRINDTEAVVEQNGKQKTVEASKEQESQAEVIVLASGNLGLIYFTEWKDRMTYEEINEAFPLVIPGLISHEGIGFILVRSAEHGAMVIGANGTYYLDEDRIEGENPLEYFGENAADHVRRTDSFANVADIMINSFYDPVTDEGAAFEELVGFHGGMGGKQMHPFMLYPADFEIGNEPLIGAEHVHHIMKSWLIDLQGEPDIQPETPVTS